MSSVQYVNIGGSQDQHYRYKMERMKLKTEGSGNGTKTVVTNTLNIANNLKVPPDYPTKFFGTYFGAQSKYDKSRDMAIINGDKSQKEMEDALDDFITKFVLCEKCNLPEVVLVVEKNEQITKNCQACGHTSTINSAHRLCRHIQKYPPPKRTIKKKTEVDESIREAEREHTSIETSEDIDVFETDTSAEAVLKRKQEETMSGRIRALTLEEEKEAKEEEEMKSPHEVLKEFLEIKEDATNGQLYAAVSKVKTDYGLKNKHCVSLLSEVFFEYNDDLVDLFKTRGALFKKYLKRDTEQKLFLSYIDEHVGINHPEMLVKTSLVLETLYDEDLVDDDVLKEWSKKKKSKFIKDSSVVKKIKEAAKPFIAWLETAEEED